MIIYENISLKEKNWFRTGGDARFFAEPCSNAEFAYALSFARRNNFEIFILGRGANIVVSDTGFKGLTIRPKMNEISKSGNIVTAGAGVEMATLIDFSLNNNLLGLEELTGIPGSIGGSVYINIHYFEFLLSNFLITAKVIKAKNSEIFEVENKWFNFGYNSSKLIQEEYYLLEASFKLKEISNYQVAYAKGRSAEMMRYRSRCYPTSHTCGSFFRNFHEDEIPMKINGKKILSVAYYLEKSNVRDNLHDNGASVSHQHANMIINNNAKSINIINIARKMQELVHSNFGIIPQPECRLIGFEEYPLHTESTLSDWSVSDQSGSDQSGLERIEFNNN